MNRTRTRRVPHGGAALCRLFVALGTLGLTLVCMTRQAAAQTIVATAQGLVQGTVSASGTSRSFLGIPYAAPPTGLGTRFWATQPHAAWTGTPYGQTAGAKCIQPDSGLTNLDSSSSEDCLYLNVVTPLGPGQVPPTNAPVVVAIPGGFFLTGDGSVSATDALPTSKSNPVVIVSINYRLGVFGFLADPRIDDGEGNLGLKDIQFALAWVHNNIANFGGNASNVTLLGDSAGGYAICALLASHTTPPGVPAGTALFQKAIVESATCAGRLRTVPKAQTIGAQLISLAGCNLGTTLASQACLTAVSKQTLFAAEETVWQAPWNGSSNPPLPVYEGFPFDVAPFEPSVGSASTSMVPEQPATAIASGNFNRVPLLAGMTHDEARIAVLSNSTQLASLVLGGDGMTYNQYVTDVGNAYFSDNANNPAAGSNNAAQVLALYPAPTSSPPPNHTQTPLYSWLSALTDWSSWCPALTGYAAAAASVPVYAYEFSDPNGFGTGTFSYSYFVLGAPHDMTADYRAGGLVLDTFFTAHPTENALSQQIIEYWTNFATTGSPNGPGYPVWTPYSAGANDSVLQLNSGAGNIVMVNVSAEHNCAFWNALPGAYSYP